MSRLVLKFQEAVVKEVPLGLEPVTIGRAPDNDIQIDNLAVSDHHARIFSENGQPTVQDLGSLNGVLLNGSSVKQGWLRTGDVIAIGKHEVVVDLIHEARPSIGAKAKVATPKLDETVVLDTRRHTDLGQHVGSGAASRNSGKGRARMASLVILKGKTNHKNYVLSGKLIVIGKSRMATVQLRGWFVPQAVAQISNRKEGYYLSPIGTRAITRNGRPVFASTLLHDGDVVEVSGVSMKFMFGD